MQWNINLKKIIKSKKLNKEELAKVAGLSRAGLYHALNSGSLKFDAMISIMTRYNIDYYELIGMENPFFKEKEDEEGISCTNMKDINININQTKEMYESKISSYKEQIVLLKAQIQFLQKMISKTINKK